MFVVKVRRRNGNDVPGGNPPFGCLSVGILVVFELHDNVLDTGDPVLQLPDGRLGHLGFVKGGGLGENSHAVCTFQKASLGARAESHDVGPGKPDELGGVVLVLDVVCFVVDVKSLHRGQDPGSVLVGSCDLGSDLFSGPCRPLGSLAVASAGRGNRCRVLLQVQFVWIVAAVAVTAAARLGLSILALFPLCGLAGSVGGYLDGVPLGLS